MLAMNRRSATTAILALTLPLLGAARSASAQFVADSSSHPLKVGDAAPGFTLKDTEGVDRTLEAAMDKSQVALVFYRSADW